MSRIGKKPILIPDNVEVKITGSEVKTKGPKGELSQKIPAGILIEKKDSNLVIYPKAKTKKSSALWGLARALVQNNFIGVTSGFEKQLEMRGIGYGALVKDEKILELKAGFSHLVKFVIPAELNIVVKKNVIIISGIDKQKVGQFAAKIRAIRPPEPYKGKGIRYVGEKVRRKEGKKVGVTG